MPKSYLALLNYAVINEDEKARAAVLLTLNKMAQGGIYDQIGGGFSRYSTDSYWHIPHFEKMLYDNAQLITLYSEAYKLTQNPYYKQIIDETINFCSTELMAEENGYFSSLDADSEGEEGKFYVWTYEEINQLLGSEATVFNKYYGVTKGGNWEDNQNVLKISTALDDLAKKFDQPENKIKTSIDNSRMVLFNARKSRIRPALDDKILTSWNGLMVSGLAHAYEALGNEDYRTKAVATGEFIWDNMWDDGKLFRNRKNGKSTINGFLDDYAFSIMAFTDLYQVTFNKMWLDRAVTLTKATLNSFYDKKSKFFQFKSASDDPLYIKKSVIEDNVIPSGNSAMAINLFVLGHLTYNEQYLKMSTEMVKISADRMLQHPAFYYNWFDLYQMNLMDPFEVAIVGDDHNHIRKELSRAFLPSTILLGGATDENLELLKSKLVAGKTMIYVCVNKTCQLPVENVNIALEQMKKLRTN